MISRRTLFGIAPLILAGPAWAADHPSVTFMKKVGAELLHAHRQGTVSAHMRVVQRHGDISGISAESIGSYKVPAGQDANYRRGVAKFIARYIVDQGRLYPIAKFEIGEATVDKDKDVIVDTKVYLMAGQNYSVSWKLNWSGNTYKIADARFLGFSMINQERKLFTGFIEKHNGDVRALITALNRM